MCLWHPQCYFASFPKRTEGNSGSHSPRCCALERTSKVQSDGGWGGGNNVAEVMLISKSSCRYKSSYGLLNRIIRHVTHEAKTIKKRGVPILKTQHCLHEM